MTRFSYRDCVREGLLRAVEPSLENARASLSAADSWLTEAGTNLDGKALNSSLMASYLAMFHAARAVLIRDGIREKSHYCIARYLEAKYAEKDMLEPVWIRHLDQCRELRHADQYDTGFHATKDEAAEALKMATGFVDRMKRLLDAKNGKA